MSVFEGLKAFRDMDVSHLSSSTSTRDLPPADSSSEQPADEHAAVRLFRPDMHIARFNRSAARQALPIIPHHIMLDDLRSWLSNQREWVPHSVGSALYVRPVLFATQSAVGVRRPEHACMLMFGVPVSKYFTKPVRLLAEDTFVRSWPGGVGDCKTAGNYALSVTPAELAAEKGFDQVLWLDGSDERYVTESGVMNFSCVIQSDRQPGRYTIVTPPLDGLILGGITRQSVLDLARTEFAHILDVEERRITLDEIRTHIESGKMVDCFGTGTAAVVSPIHSITFDGKEHVVERKAIDCLQAPVSEVMRNRITQICHSDHPWMHTVEDASLEHEEQYTPSDTSHRIKQTVY